MERMELTESKKELEHDFIKCLKDVDFKNYNPYSRSFMEALFIGQMWELICRLGNHVGSTDEESDMQEHATAASSVQKKHEDILEEIDGARKYLKMANTTGDSVYKGMASDELRHAEILMKKAGQKFSSPEDKKFLAEMENTVKQITSQM